MMLFWDKISRIVPQSYSPQDSEDIIMIKNESDFLEDYILKDSDVSYAVSQFIYVLDNMLLNTDYVKKVRQYKSRDVKNNKTILNIKGDFIRTGHIPSTTGTYIHLDKIGWSLTEQLHSYGLAETDQYFYEGWVKVDSEIGFLYMNYLANAISQYYKMPIITDVTESFFNSTLFRSIGYKNYNNAFQQNMGSILIDVVVPKYINNIHISKIIEVRDKMRDERAAFFNRITNYTNSVNTIDSPEELLECTQRISRVIKKDIREFEKIYNSYGIDVIRKFLSISLPTTIGSLMNVVDDQAEPFILVGGVLVGVLFAINDAIKGKAELNRDPFSYLFDLKREFDKESFFSELSWRSEHVYKQYTK